MKRMELSILMLFMTFLNGCMSFSHFERERVEETFVNVHLHKAAEHARGADHSEALKNYKIALTVDSSNPEATEGRNRVEALIKNSAEESYRRGLEAQKQGRYVEAQREFLTALRLRPDYPEAFEKVSSGKESTVTRHILHKIRPGESLSQLALVYYGDPQKYPIIARYNNLRDAGLIRVGQEIVIPDPGVVHRPAGGASSRTSREFQWSGFEVEATAEEADGVSVYREQGIELFEEKRFEEALAEFKKVLTVRPKDNVAREYSYRSSFEVAMALFGSGEYLAARDQFKQSLDYKSECPKCEVYVRKSEDLYKEMHYKKGMQHYGKEQLTEAIMEWEMVRNLDPNYKRVEDYIQRARELQNKLEYLKMELEQGGTSTEESYRLLNKT